MDTIEEILKEYKDLVSGIDKHANSENEEGNRSYGGVVRSAKGTLVEDIAKKLVKIAWYQLGGDSNKLSFQKQNIRIPLNKEYLKKVRPTEVANHINTHIKRYFYGLKTDVHVNIGGYFVMGIECKTYTENAMLKRILVDFTLLKKVYPDLICVLLQLESQLTGDYSQPLSPIIYGSPSTHTLLSYFDVDLNIITLLEGERNVNQPIHKPEYFKEMKKESLLKAVETLKSLLSKYV